MKDLIGQKFGKLTVIKFIGKLVKGNKPRYFYECKCECGNIVIRNVDTLKEGVYSSCGCFKSGHINKTHGLWAYGNKLYGVWQTMKARCFRKSSEKYYLYGARGITVCDEWKNNFVNFYNWANANGYKEGLSIDRIDVNGNYEPNNCRWITNKMQARNRRTNKLYTYNNETHCLIEWAEILKIEYKCLFHRLQQGWSIEKAFTTPYKKIKRRNI